MMISKQSERVNGHLVRQLHNNRHNDRALARRQTKNKHNQHNARNHNAL